MEARVETTETCAPTAAPHPRARRRRRLATLANVRTALADALWRLETDAIAPSKTRALIYGYSVLAGIIEGSDLEARIERLESAGREPR